MEKISRTIIGPESEVGLHVTSAQARVILKPGTESFQSHALSDRGENAVCNAACILFGFRSISASEVAGKRVLEIGSADRNGSLRPIIESYHPREYVGSTSMPTYSRGWYDSMIGRRLPFRSADPISRTLLPATSDAEIE